MALLSNSPRQPVPLLLEARKSFSLALHLRDHTGAPIDVTGYRIDLTWVTQPHVPEDSVFESTTTSTKAAAVTSAVSGEVRFELQAQDLDLDPGTYPYSITLSTPGEYSLLLVRGLLEIRQNTEFVSVADAYAGVQPPLGVEVSLADRNVVEVRTGALIPEGYTLIPVADLVTLQALASATTLTEGLARLATDAEAIAGTRTDRVLTPASLRAVLVAEGLI